LTTNVTLESLFIVISIFQILTKFYLVHFPGKPYIIVKCAATCLPNC